MGPKTLFQLLRTHIAYTTARAHTCSLEHILVLAACSHTSRLSLLEGAHQKAEAGNCPVAWLGLSCSGCFVDGRNHADNLNSKWQDRDGQSSQWSGPPSGGWGRKPLQKVLLPQSLKRVQEQSPYVPGTEHRHAHRFKAFTVHCVQSQVWCSLVCCP